MFLIRDLWVASYSAIDFQCQIVNDNCPWHFLDPVITTSTMTTGITSSHKSMNRFVSFSFYTFNKGCPSALAIFERPSKILQIVGSCMRVFIILILQNYRWSTL